MSSGMRERERQKQRQREIKRCRKRCRKREKNRRDHSGPHTKIDSWRYLDAASEKEDGSDASTSQNNDKKERAPRTVCTQALFLSAIDGDGWIKE